MSMAITRNLRLSGALCVIASLSWPAMAATHVLECRTQRGERFELRSDYHKRLFPALTPLNSPTSNHQPWQVRYYDAQGKEHSEGLQDVRVAWHGDAAWALERYCADFGVVEGQALGPSIYLDARGFWVGTAAVAVHSQLRTEHLREAVKPTGALGQAGFSRFGVQRLGVRQGLLIHEVALFATGHDAAQHPVQGVYQSQSPDGGLSWSAPVIREQGLLFEIGRTLPDHCSAARPVRYDRQALTVPAAPACSAK